MALITVSGEPGSRFEEAARLAAQRLHFELVTGVRLESMLEGEFGPSAPIPGRAWPDVAASVVARLTTEHHLVAAFSHAELLPLAIPGALRIAVVASEARRVGNLMLDRRVDRSEARRLLKDLDAQRRSDRRARFGRATVPPHTFDAAVNAGTFDSDEIAALIESVAKQKGIEATGLLSPAAEAQIQFQIRLKLARHGLTPPGQVKLKRNTFVHPSEEIFARLLDFYRVAWEYEPRSFPIQWDRDGRVLESFTPDFYLPDFDLYVELTTMKQSLVTKKNRKVKLLREIYPHINIQVFYQKDFQNLIFKYGLADRIGQS